jgi:invasion protein IalB
MKNIIIPVLLMAGLAAQPASAADETAKGAKDQMFTEWTKVCAQHAKSSVSAVRAGVPAAAKMTDETILRITFDDFYTSSTAELKEAVQLMKGERLLPNEALFLCFAEVRLKIAKK